MKRLPLLMVCLAMSCMSAFADDAKIVETVTVNGSTVDKFVTKLTFSGDDVVLNFEDYSTQTAGKSLVSIDFTYPETTGLKDVNTDNDESVNSRVYNISGQYVGISTEGLERGIYITKGKKFVVK